MKFAFWKKKGGDPKEAELRAKAPEGESKEPVEAPVASAEERPEAPRVGWSRLQRIAVGAAVLLSAFVIAAPFFVSDRAIEAETAAKTEIPPAPSGDQASGDSGAAQPGAADVSSAVPAAPAGDASSAMPVQSSATAAGNTVPAAPSIDTAPVRSAEDAEKLKAQTDAAAASRSAAIARENAKAKAEIEKKAAAGKQAAEDQLALAIQSEAKKGADKKAAAKDAKKDAASGAWIVPIGAFSDAAAANKVAATARKNGVSVSVSQVKTNKGTLTRVTAGPFKSRGEAEVAEGRLAMAGIRAGAVRQAK